MQIVFVLNACFKSEIRLCSLLRSDQYVIGALSMCVIEPNYSIFKNTRNITIIIKLNGFDNEECYRIESFSIKKLGIPTIFDQKMRYLDRF